MTDRELDRMCWLLVSWRNRFAPPDETAEECIGSIDDLVDSEFEESKEKTISNDEAIRLAGIKVGGRVGHEHGYHEGMFIAHNEMMEQLYGYGINVMGRANRYTKVNREHDMEFRLTDEPNYYHAVERGAEVKVMQNPMWEDIEIESLGPAPYVPRGADSE